MSYNPSIPISILSTTTGIDGKVATTTNLYTVPAGYQAVITGAVFFVTTATALTVICTAGVGQNVTQDDIFSAVALTGLTTSKLFTLNSLGTISACPAATVIKLGIDIGATATTLTLRVDLLGYLTS